jgi:poly(A) polymerase
VTETPPQPGPPQSWLAEPATQRLMRAFAAAGIEARFVGGIVRDGLLGRLIGDATGDIDLATPALPEAVTAALRRARIKVVPTGIAHGTVTAILPPRVFEITTLRRDIATDGRRATVAFGTDWDADAARRDFTINALYRGFDGTLYDPVGGIADLHAGRVRFVGDPARRIAEDVLRLLRYYRFEARFGSGAGDAAARAACRDAVGALPTLSAERVAQELAKLLDAPAPVAALRMMQADGVLAALLPEADSINRLERLIAIEPAREPERDWLRRLAALITTDRTGAVALARRLRFSGAARERLGGLAQPWPLDPAGDPRAQRRALHRLGRERYRDLALLVAADRVLPPARLAGLLAAADAWEAPAFPLRGADVAALGIAPGAETGRLLGAVRRWWEGGDFTADRDACLARLREIAGRA